MGLTQRQALELRKKYGENSTEGKSGSSAVKIFAGQFRDVMVMILLAATVISVFLGEIYDAVTITAIVLLNAVLGFIQEYRTEKTLEALSKMTAPTAKAYRDGVLSVIKASELVPQDIVELEAGDRVPADCAVLESFSLSADESMLSGESVPVMKRAGNEQDTDNSLGKANIVYSGTVITKGSGRARVIATGGSAQIGKISGMISEAGNDRTPLQKRLGELGKIVALICIAVCVIVFFAGVLRGEPVFDMLMTGITIAIAAIPEGLPATVTIALALAVRRMLKVKALVNKLHSVETLGCTSVICSDKTGTITENKMTVKRIFADLTEYDVSGNGNSVSGEITWGGRKAVCEGTLGKLLECGVLCSTAKIEKQKPKSGLFGGKKEWKAVGDPTETALLIAAAKGGVLAENYSGFRKISEEPFDSETKMMSVRYKIPSGGEVSFVKGAPDVLMKKCTGMLKNGETVPFHGNALRRTEREVGELSAGGMRVLALAYRENGGELVFLGLAAMTDPPREEAKRAIKKCAEANIKTVMITGDHRETAAAVAKEAGILKNKSAVTGAELDAMSDEELDRRLDDYAVFARVSPLHKLRLVRAYKRRGNVVTMTGDGVNDAPAIKEADVGVAMGLTGTDVAKQAADVILLDDNFATIVRAVEQGRGIYSNIRKFVRYLLSCNIGEVIVMFLGIILGLPMVLLPTQLLLVNLVTDGLPAVALGMEPAEKDVMKNKPRGVKESFFSGGLLTKIIFRGIFIGLSTLLCFTVIFNMTGSIVCARTAALTTLILSQLIHVFECKSEKKSLFRINIFSNMKLVGAVLISLAVLALSVYLPAAQLIFGTAALGTGELAVSVGLSFAVPVLSAFSSIFGRKDK